MRPPILLAALLWLQDSLAQVRWAWGRVGWAWGRVGWVGLFSGACLGFPPLYGAPQLVFIMAEGNRSLPSQASTEAGRKKKKLFQPSRLLAAGYCLLLPVQCFQELSLQ